MTGSFVPSPRQDVSLVEVGDEAVIVDGWNQALVLNRPGVMIWERLDGEATLEDVAEDLAEATGADPGDVIQDVRRFVECLGRDGFLEEYAAFGDDNGDGLELVPVPPIQLESILSDVHGVDAAGRRASLLDPAGGPRFVVKWNPFCGYCAGIAHQMSELQSPLSARGIEVLLVCVGDVETNKEAMEASERSTGIKLEVVYLSADDDPFPSVGTPSADHVDGAGMVVSPTAHGSDEVPDLAASLAGVVLDQGIDERGGTIRYLRSLGGMCGADLAPVPGDWATTRVYRISDHHVGIRVDTEATGAVLDELFPDARVDDDRAGHSYSVSLPGAPQWDADLGLHDRDDRSDTGTEAPTRSAGLNLVIKNGDGLVVRSRDPGRALQALLAHLDDDINGGDPGDGIVRVMRRAVVVDGEAAILPAEAELLMPRLQPMLARLGIALVDVPRPTVDLNIGELVITSPGIDHDAGLVARLSTGAALGRTERPVVEAGRYPLRTWCIVRHGPGLATPASSFGYGGAFKGASCVMVQAWRRG